MSMPKGKARAKRAPELFKELGFVIRIKAVAESVNIVEVLEKLRETGAAELKRIRALKPHHSFPGKPVLEMEFHYKACPMGANLSSLKDELGDIFSGGMTELEIPGFTVGE